MMSSPHPSALAGGIIHGILAGIGLIANAIVIFVLIVARDRQDSSSVVYIFNLAIADFFFLTTTPFMISHDLSMEWLFGNSMCQLAIFIMYLNFFVSPLLLMVMSIDRYLAVNKASTSSKLRSLKTSRWVSLIVWSVGIIANLPVALLHSSAEGTCIPAFPKGEMNNETCTFEKIAECVDNRGMIQGTMQNESLEMNTTEAHRTSEYSQQIGWTEGDNLTTQPNISSSRIFETQTDGISGTSIYDQCVQLLCGGDIQECKDPISMPTYHTWKILNSLYSYFIPMTVITIFYVAILRNVYRPRRMDNSMTNGRARRQAMRKRVTLMVALLVISYVMCFTPFYVWNLLIIRGVSVSGTWICGYFTRFHATMAVINSLLNPILYTFLGERFGVKLKLAFRRFARSTRNTIGPSLSVKFKMDKNRRRSTLRQPLREDKQATAKLNPNGEAANRPLDDARVEENRVLAREGSSRHDETENCCGSQRLSRCLPCIHGCRDECPVCENEEQNYRLVKDCEVTEPDREADLRDTKAVYDEQTNGKYRVKLCKKHRKSEKENSSAIDDSSYDASRWRSSNVKYQTEVTALASNL